MADYNVYVKTPAGALVEVLTDFLRLDYYRKENNVGVLTLELPPDTDGLASILALDNRFEVWRRIGAAAFAQDVYTAFLLRRWSEKTANGETRVILRAVDANDLLRRRIVYASAGTAGASKAGPADDVMKEIVYEQVGAGAAAARQTPSYTVQVDAGAGATIDKAFAYRDVMLVLQELAQQSLEAGTYLAFDTVQTLTGFEFRTFAGQRATDRRIGQANAVIMSIEAGTLSEAELIKNYENEVSFVYAGGRGEGAGRNIQTATDAGRAAASIYNRIEAFKDARNVPTATGENDYILGEAAQRLEQGRPIVSLLAKAQDTDTVKYGREYYFGDLVTGVYDGAYFDMHVDAVHITVEGGEEKLDVKLRSVQ